MKTVMKLSAVLAFVVLLNYTARSQNAQITAAEAKDRIGERATVCGNVASSRFASKSKGQPTFLNLEKSYPNKVFTVVIWGEDRSKFDKPESKYQDHKICVSGKITNYQGEPEIVASSPSQVEIQK